MKHTILSLRVAVGAAVGFATGLALTNKLIEGERTDWAATVLLGWNILASAAVGFLLGSLLRGWLDPYLTRQTTRWALLGLALGPLCAVVVQLVYWDMGQSFLGITRGVAAIGAWNGFLLGIAFRSRNPYITKGAIQGARHVTE